MASSLSSIRNALLKTKPSLTAFAASLTNSSEKKLASGCQRSYPNALSFCRYLCSSSPEDAGTGRTTNSMNFVKGILEQDGMDILGRPQYSQYNIEQNADIVNIKLLRNNAFVTLTDAKGNKKFGASAGSLPDMKGGGKVSRYAAEAAAEHVGRMARNLGVKAVVVRVNGFAHFKKKKQAIMGFKDGFSSRRDQHPIVYIEDTTRKAHNGCRLRKQRRV